MKKIVLMFCLMLTACGLTAVGFSTANAAGFALYEWSSRGNGMGGALTALVDDASAIAYNPAAMTRAEGTQALAGVTAIAPRADIEIGGETYKTKGKVYLPPHAYITHQMNDDLWVGFGTYTRFGVGTNYEDDWAQAKNVYKASLQAHTLSPTAAYKITDKWSVGVGVDAMWLSFDLRQKSPFNRDVHLDNSGWAWGGNISTHYEFNDQFSMGLIYRSPQRLVGSGEVSVKSGPNEGTEDLTMRATLPGSATLGLAYKPADWWRVELDAVYTNWSDYRKIEYRWGSKTAAELTGVATNTDVNSTKKWHNTIRFQLGSEFDLDEHNTLRLGFVWDQCPINEEYRDYMLPSNDRMMYSAGYGYKQGPWSFDFSLMYLNMRDTYIDTNENHVATITQDAHISNSHAWLGGFSVNYDF